MKTFTFSFDTKELGRAAISDGTTPENYVSKMRSISLGRKVCAHFVRTDGTRSIFVCE